MFISPVAPPPPQALINGLIKLQEKIDGQSIKTVRWYQKGDTAAIPVPMLGPDLIYQSSIPAIKEAAQEEA